VDLHQQKERVGAAAVDYVEGLYPDRLKLGIGTGSTAECFIRGLVRLKHRIEVTVASSARSEALLKELGLPVVDLNQVESLDAYIDGADEINASLEMIKGGGAALTREKIVAAASETFVCIADETKLVEVLGAFPLPVEVIPMARSYAARKLLEFGGQPVWREGLITDNGNVIVDLHAQQFLDPCKAESELNDVAGIVSNGLFARRPADLLLLATPDGVSEFSR
jgi:ribose 5-phosphate isomerase A